MKMMTGIAIANVAVGAGFWIALLNKRSFRSSLNCLRRLPLASLKLDHSFLEQRKENDDVVALASGIIAMAQALGIKVIAEGAETTGQLEFLAIGAAIAAQGYLFSEPLPAADCRALLQRRQTTS